MRGHEQLRAMRLRGFRPRLVLVHVGHDVAQFWRDWREETPEHAHIEIADGEPLSSLDMRCVVGLPVVITGDDARRVDAVFEACVACDAARVITTERDSVECDQ